MNPRHPNCLAHFGDPPDGSIDVRESVYMYIYKEKIVREHLTGPQHYPDNGLVSGTRGEVSRNQEEEDRQNYKNIFLLRSRSPLSETDLRIPTFMCKPRPLGRRMLLVMLRRLWPVRPCSPLNPHHWCKIDFSYRGRSKMWRFIKF
ncbi:hypothetical protein AVEN_57368-1 [Araneus ventricosus]|uniref:Uncharacterized protein n=1 Tax=Araneus ventricosus TaxID=182803 RepID=A0A4Y2J192_ARAVE|nr:hypothetical protein AVEN_57368-1 [Araneus ventricosus]